MASQPVQALLLKQSRAFIIEVFCCHPCLYIFVIYFKRFLNIFQNTVICGINFKYGAVLETISDVVSDSCPVNQEVSSTDKNFKLRIDRNISFLIFENNIIEFS